MKLKNLRVFAGAMAIVAAANSASINSSAKTKDKSYVCELNPNINYGMDNSVELLIPVAVKDTKNGQSYEYATVLVDNSKSSINPTELVNVIAQSQKLHKKDGTEEFVYIDSNETTNKSFKVNSEHKSYTYKLLMGELEKQDKEVQKQREKIDRGAYAEFTLPIMGSYNYSVYKNGQSVKKTFRRVEYIYFYMPYENLSNKTDFSELATYAYERYQTSFDHVITHKELEVAKRNVKK